MTYLKCWLTCPIITVLVPSGMFTVRLNRALLDPSSISTSVFGPENELDRNERNPEKRIALIVMVINE